MKPIAYCLLAAGLVSTSALAQPAPYAAEERIHWIDGETLTLTYSHTGAPGSVSSALAAEVLADIEAKFDALDFPGLDVAIGNRDIGTGCASANRNTVHICWEPRSDSTSISTNNGRSDGAGFWREGNILLSSSYTWTEATLYRNLMHQLLHVLGFAHPVAGASVQTGAVDLTQVDIDGLQGLYGARSCALTFNTMSRTADIPFVRYNNVAYRVRLQQDGGNNFSLAPGSVGVLNATNMPTSRCQHLEVDGNNQLHIPELWVGGRLTWATLRLENGGLTLINRGP